MNEISTRAFTVFANDWGIRVDFTELKLKLKVNNSFSEVSTSLINELTNQSFLGH